MTQPSATRRDGKDTSPWPAGADRLDIAVVGCRMGAVSARNP